MNSREAVKFLIKPAIILYIARFIIGAVGAFSIFVYINSRFASSAIAEMFWPIPSGFALVELTGEILDLLPMLISLLVFTLIINIVITQFLYGGIYSMMLRSKQFMITEFFSDCGKCFAGFLKILPVFIFVLPGAICFALYPDLAHGDLAYTTMISNWFPVGIRGVMIAVLIAALLSTMDAGLNSISTIVTLDIFRRWFPNASHDRLLWIGRIATAGAMVIAIVWSPVIGKFPKGIFIAIAQLIACVAPPLTAEFLKNMVLTIYALPGLFR